MASEKRNKEKKEDEEIFKKGEEKMLDLAEKLKKVRDAKDEELSIKIAELKVLESAYRDAAKKSLAAEKAGQFEAAKKFKAESLKGYADWKKLKLELVGQ